MLSPPPEEGGGVWSGCRYVTQDDIFLGNLTVREILVFSARLRLPKNLAYREKLSRVRALANRRGGGGRRLS